MTEPVGLIPDELTPTIVRTTLREGRTAEVVAALAQLSPMRRAELFLQLRWPEQKTLLAAANPELSASILADCDSASLRAVLMRMDLPALTPALRLIPPDNLADILLHLPPDTSRQVQDLLDPSLRDEIRKLMTFDPESAGGLMTTRYLSIPDAVTVGKALDLLRAARADAPASYIYVVDVNGRLIGVAPVRGLLLSHARRPVRAIMSADPVRIKATAPREEIVNLFNQYHYVSLPVVDDKERLIGIVTFDDIMAAMRRGEEQIVRGMTGADPREALKETFSAARGRLPWVTVTIAGGLACAFIAGLFRHTLGEMVVLAIFIPVVLAVGESIGSQTISVVLTTLVAGEVRRARVLSFLTKELFIGIVLGGYAGAVVSAASMLWHGSPRLGLMIGAAVFLSVSWAAMLGALIPSLVRGMRIDPIIASGPLVLALTDISTLLVYFGTATLFMNFGR
ncbi:MAG: magnesium transporter [Planctomycetes bacterium]|nr:magnesium transporter [Planctomycetota bacterium]